MIISKSYVSSTSRLKMSKNGHGPHTPSWAARSTCDGSYLWTDQWRFARNNSKAPLAPSRSYSRAPNSAFFVFLPIVFIQVAWTVRSHFSVGWMTRWCPDGKVRSSHTSHVRVNVCAWHRSVLWGCRCMRQVVPQQSKVRLLPRRAYVMFLEFVWQICADAAAH